MKYLLAPLLALCIGVAPAADNPYCGFVPGEIWPHLYPIPIPICEGWDELCYLEKRRALDDALGEIRDQACADWDLEQEEWIDCVVEGTYSDEECWNAFAEDVAYIEEQAFDAAFDEIVAFIDSLDECCPTTPLSMFAVTEYKSPIEALINARTLK